MAIVGMVDSIVAARENGAKFGYAVSANRDLVALGAANVVASTMLSTGSLPVYGSITRKFSLSALFKGSFAGSRLNAFTGARSQMASIITSIVIILSIYFLLPFLYFLPKVDCPGFFGVFELSLGCSGRCYPARCLCS